MEKNQRESFSRLLKDLEKYREMALDMGGEDALIIPASEIPLTLRAYYKCLFPRCPAQGSNLHCPPLWKTPWEEAKLFMRSYNYAIFYRAYRRPEDTTGPRWLRGGFTSIYSKYMNRDDVKKAVGEEFRSDKVPADASPDTKITRGTAKISRAIEVKARNDGYNFAITFASGNCLMPLCGKFGTTCIGLKTGLCRHPGQSRPEGSAAMYIDFMALAAKVGWKTSLQGFCIHPEDVPEEFPTYWFSLVLIN